MEFSEHVSEKTSKSRSIVKCPASNFSTSQYTSNVYFQRPSKPGSLEISAQETAESESAASAGAENDRRPAKTATRRP